jgi:hypothetical protein
VSDETEPLNLARIGDVEIRNDGQEVKLTFQGFDGRCMGLVLHVAQVGSLMNSLAKMMSLMQLAINVPVLKPKEEFTRAPAIYQIKDLQAVSYPEIGGLDIQFEAATGERFVACLHPQMVQQLFRHLLETQPLDQDPQ